MHHDDAYASFADLQMDLQLMLNRPSYFIGNIHVSTFPKLVIHDKLYGQEEELSKLDQLFKRHITGTTFSGTHRSSPLNLMYTSCQMSLKPMSTITNLFDSPCAKWY